MKIVCKEFLRHRKDGPKLFNLFPMPTRVTINAIPVGSMSRYPIAIDQEPIQTNNNLLSGWGSGSHYIRGSQ
jgi:hypothetical protein